MTENGKRRVLLGREQVMVGPCEECSRQVWLDTEDMEHGQRVIHNFCARQRTINDLCAQQGDEIARAKNWGHKVTVHIYVAGDIEAAADVSDEMTFFVNESDREGQPYIDAEFVGISIETVETKPTDQIAT